MQCCWWSLVSIFSYNIFICCFQFVWQFNWEMVGPIRFLSFYDIFCFFIIFIFQQRPLGQCWPIFFFSYFSTSWFMAYDAIYSFYHLLFCQRLFLAAHWVSIIRHIAIDDVYVYTIVRWSTFLECDFTFGLFILFVFASFHFFQFLDMFQFANIMKKWWWRRVNIADIFAIE